MRSTPRAFRNAFAERGKPGTARSAKNKQLSGGRGGWQRKRQTLAAEVGVCKKDNVANSLTGALDPASANRPFDLFCLLVCFWPWV